MEKKDRKIEFVSNKDIRDRVRDIINTNERVKKRGGDYLIPFPKLLELDDQEQLLLDLLEGKKETKRNLVANRETTKKLQQKFHNYWEAHKNNPESYEKISGKHSPALVWEHFLDCKEGRMVQSQIEGSRWVFNCAYQVADGTGYGKNKKPRPINRYIAEDSLRIKSHLDIQSKIDYFEKTIETVTKELRDIDSRLAEIKKKKNRLIEKEYEERDAQLGVVRPLPKNLDSWRENLNS